MKQTACKDCGVIIDIESFDDSKEYSCPRCHTVFYRAGESFDLVLVMVITSFLFFIPATFLPIMTLEIMGQTHSVTLFEAVWFFVNDGYVIIALIAAGAGVVIPLSILFLIIMMIIPIKLGYGRGYVKTFYRWYVHMSTWAMAEVYLISIFVAIVKLGGMAELQLDFGLFSFGFFIIAFYISIIWFNPNDLWNTNVIQN
jgi:paraquat-inducible protein A